MSRRLLGLLFVSVLLPVASVVGDISVFEDSVDVHPVGESGRTEFLGYVNDDGRLVGQYLVSGGGDGIQGRADAFHYAYRTLTGDWRLSADFEWVGTPADDWAKQGVMIRASTDPDAVNCAVVTANDLKGNNRTDFQWRSTKGGGTSELHADVHATRLGVQRVLIGGEIPAIEGIADFGNGWERIGELKILPELADEALFGVAVTSHTWDSTATSRVSDVVYERAELVGPAPVIAQVPSGAAKQAAPTDRYGFVVRAVKATFTDSWGRMEMNKLLDFGCTGPLCLGPGMPVHGVEAGSREEPFVNLHDAGDRGVFGGDKTFPGIDPIESPTADPAGGDDDDYFATEVMAIIHLTYGLHVIGVYDDGGTIVEIGGIEIGRSGDEKPASTTDFIFKIEQEGFYTLRARHLEASGPAALELHEVIKTADGSWERILLGDVANGGSAVYIPEPATLSLFALGGLAVTRRKRS